MPTGLRGVSRDDFFCSAAANFMKKIFKVKDKYKGFIEFYKLKNNNRRKNDLIWIHWKDYLGKNENGITITKDEAKYFIQGLKLVLKTF